MQRAQDTEKYYYMVGQAKSLVKPETEAAAALASRVQETD
jgi:hypothetical protein